MESLAGKRYENLNDLKSDIEKVTKRKIYSIQESMSERPKGTDYMIDYCFKDDIWDIRTLFYLKDNANNYFITEV